MGAVKQKEPMVECYHCHQLVMFSATQDIPIADGPDDFTMVPLCDMCAEKYAQSRENEPGEEVDS